MRCLVVGVLVAAACGASHELPPGDGKPIDGPATTGSDAGVDAAWTWQTLITNTWTMPANASGISCHTIPITQEAWIDGFRPAGPMDPANDHLFVMITSSSSCSGTQPLGPSDELIYAAGLGMADLELSAGTAVHVAPGTSSTLYLKLYDHVSNETSSPISGTSAIEAHYVADPTTVVHDVDMVLGGLGSFSIGAGTDAVKVGQCTPTTTPGYQWHLVALWPHMHESGTHVSVGFQGQTPFFDEAYDYQHERTYTIPDTLVDTNALLDVSCTLQNANPVTLTYGEFVPEAMGNTVCWTGLYKYPTGTDPSTAPGTFYGPEACVVSSPSQYRR
jgi:hypothetical protein